MVRSQGPVARRRPAAGDGESTRDNDNLFPPSGDDERSAQSSVGKSWWRRLNEPTGTIGDESERRSARLLASLILIALALGVLSAAIQYRASPVFPRLLPSIAGALVVLSICYALARSGLHRVAGVVTSFVPVVAGFAVGLTQPDDPAWFAFMTLGIVFASAFLAPGSVAAIGGLTVAAIAVVLWIGSASLAPSTAAPVLIYSTLVSALTVVVMRHHRLMEMDRERHRREDEARYRTLFENAPLGIGIVDERGYLIEVNDALARTAGYRREDLSSLSNVETLYYDPAVQADLLEQLDRDGRLVGRELQIRAKDGSPYDISLSLVPVTLGGRVHRLVIVEDIMPRRRAEAERLRADEERRNLAETIERSLNEIYMFDADTLRFEYANQGARTNIGYTMDQLRALTPLDLKPEFTETAFRQKIQPLLTGETSLLSFETIHRRANGTFYPVEVQLQPAMRARRRLLLAIILDITARKHAEAATRREAERLRIAIGTTALTVFEVDRLLRYTWIYPPGFGLPMDDVLGRTDREIFKDQGELLMSLKGRVLETGQPARQEIQIGVAGRQRAYLVTLEPHWSETRQLVGLRGAALDITEFKEVQAQFFQAQKLEAIGRLAGGVAHDFNNLLTVIKGNLELALAEPSVSGSVREELSWAAAAADSAALVTQQLLAFSRRQVIDPQPLDLNDVVRASENLLRRLLGEQVELHIRAAADLGFVRFDRGQCDQVLMNLVVNARDAMPAGGKLTLETALVHFEAVATRDGSVLPAGTYVTLAVSDTGHGMTPDVMAHVFEPFFTTKPHRGGTGLGLAMVEGAVSQHGGRVDVASEPGRGTTFRIILPALDVTSSTATVTSADAIPRGTETVLVVEDEDLVRELARRMLERQGYTVHAFRDAHDALEGVRSITGPVHLLFTDTVMPGMNGRALADRLSQLRPGIRVLYTSGYTADVIAPDGVLDGALDFLPKPYSSAALGARVRQALDAPR